MLTIVNDDGEFPLTVFPRAATVVVCTACTMKVHRKGALKVRWMKRLFAQRAWIPIRTIPYVQQHLAS